MSDQLRIALTDNDGNKKALSSLVPADFLPMLWVHPTTGRILVDVGPAYVPPTGASATQVQGAADVNAAKVGNPVLGAGLYQDPNSYDPNGVAGNVAPLVMDFATGALLVSQRSLSLLTDSVAAHKPRPAAVIPVSITNATTSYVFSNPIDLADYEKISFVPEVTTAAGGTNATQKIQWSLDGTNWFNNTHDAFGTPGGDEVALSQDAIVKTFSAVSTGYIAGAAQVFDRRGRYARIGSKNDATNNVVIRNWVQLL